MIEKHGSLIYGTEDEIMEAIREKEQTEMINELFERELRSTLINEV